MSFEIQPIGGKGMDIQMNTFKITFVVQMFRITLLIEMIRTIITRPEVLLMVRARFIEEIVIYI